METAQPDSGTAGTILDVAEALVQTRGFNGFSYADVSAELGITKAALHYHFPTKADLGHALIQRYAARFLSALAKVDAEATDPRSKLDAYARVYADVAGAGRMCLCGMLAAEYRTLPAQMQDDVQRFFDDNEAWLERVLEEGRVARTLRFSGSARDAARMIVGGLEGAMLVSQPFGDVDRFRSVAEQLLASLTDPATSR
jgi:TetR/AcrR family transcriptional repressor of nem operon